MQNRNGEKNEQSGSVGDGNGGSEHDKANLNAKQNANINTVT